MARTLIKAITDKRKNILINGNFDYWQRGFSLTTTSAYGADRWRGNSAIDTQVRRDRTYSAGLPVGSTYGNEVTSLSGGGSILQRIEAKMLIGLEGKTVTVSFKAGLVSGSTTVKVSIRKANATDDWSSSSIAYSSPVLGTPGAHTSPYSTFSYSFLVTQDMVDKGIDVELEGDSSVWTVIFSQVMLTEGAPGSEFRLAGTGLPEELLLCQRYFEKSFAVDFPPANGSGSWASGSENDLYSGWSANNNTGTTLFYKAPKRTVPTMTFYGNGSAHWYAFGVGFNANATVGWSLGKESGWQSQQAFAGHTMVTGHYTLDAEL